MNSTMKRADDAAWDTYFAMDAPTPSGQVDWARHDHTESSFEHDDIDEETLWRGASEAIETLAGDGLSSSGFSGAMDESPPLSEGAKRRMDGRRRRSLDGIDQASLSPRVLTIAEDATIGPTEHGDETARMVTPVTQKATQKRLDAVFAAQEESPRRTVLGNVTNARPRR